MGNRMKLEPLILKPLADGPMAASVVAGNRQFVAAHQPVVEEEPTEPTFSEAELKAAERDGYQKGFLEGVKDGRLQMESEQATINKQLAALGGKFEASVMPLYDDYKRMYLRIATEMPKIALAVAKKVAGNALEENAAQQVADIITRCCESLMNEPQLTITAHESLGDALEKMLSGLAARLPETTQILILRAPNIPLSDCKIDWKLGAMHYSTQEMWDKVEKAIHNMAALSVQEHEAQMEQLKITVETGEAPAPQAAAEDSEAPTEQEAEAEAPPTAEMPGEETEQKPGDTPDTNQ